jgi:hypothetical protein
VTISAAIRRGLGGCTRGILAIDGSPLPGDELDLEFRFTLPEASGMLRIALVDCLDGNPEWTGTTRSVASALSAPTCVLPGTRLSARFDCADESVRSAAGEGTGPGWKAAMVGVCDDGALVASLGDVRVYRLVEDYLGCLTTRYLGTGTGGVLGTGRILGAGPPRILDVEENGVQLRRGDRLLLTTNGVHGTLRLDEGRLSEPAAYLPLTLVERAVSRGTRQDAAAVLVHLG